MPYNFVADSFNIKKLCSFLQASAILHRKRPFCVFKLPFPFRGLGATYDDHLRLTGKCAVDFLLVAELFARFYG